MSATLITRRTSEGIASGTATRCVGPGFIRFAVDVALIVAVGLLVLTIRSLRTHVSLLRQAGDAIEELKSAYADDPFIAVSEYCKQEIQQDWHRIYEGKPAEQALVWDEDQFRTFFRNEENITSAMLVLANLIVTMGDRRLTWWRPLREACQSDTELLAQLLEATFTMRGVIKNDGLKELGLDFHSMFARLLQNKDRCITSPRACLRPPDRATQKRGNIFNSFAIKILQRLQTVDSSLEFPWFFMLSRSIRGYATVLNKNSVESVLQAFCQALRMYDQSPCAHVSLLRQAEDAIEELKLAYASDPFIVVSEYCEQEIQQQWHRIYEGEPAEQALVWGEDQFRTFFRNKEDVISAIPVLIKLLVSAEDRRLTWWGPLLEACQRDTEWLAHLLMATFAIRGATKNDELKGLGLNFYSMFARLLQNKDSIESVLQAFCQTLKERENVCTRSQG